MIQIRCINAQQAHSDLTGVVWPAIKALFGESAWSDIKVWIEQNPIEQRKT